MPDIGDGCDGFVIVHQFVARGCVPEGGILPEQPAARGEHREKASPERTGEEEAFVAVAPPEVIDVGDRSGGGDIGIKSLADVAEPFVVAAQVLVGAAELRQVSWLLLEAAGKAALDFRNPIKQWLRESLDKGGDHADLAVVGPGDELTGSVFHHTQHLNERIAGFPARPRQGIIHP